jgi:hypothetical protein
MRTLHSRHQASMRRNDTTTLAVGTARTSAAPTGVGASTKTGSPALSTSRPASEQPSRDARRRLARMMSSGISTRTARAPSSYPKTTNRLDAHAGVSAWLGENERELAAWIHRIRPLSDAVSSLDAMYRRELAGIAGALSSPLSKTKTQSTFTDRVPVLHPSEKLVRSKILSVVSPRLGPATNPTPIVNGLHRGPRRPPGKSPTSRVTED